MRTWVIDFEFRAEPGHRPRPWCLVGIDAETGETVRAWLDGAEASCPVVPPDRMVAHYALAELGCYEVLGWTFPDQVVDTLAEARTVRGQVPIGGWGLLSVAHWLGVDTMSAEHKGEMRSVAMAEEVAPEDRELLLDYCQDDVRTTLEVWRRLAPHVDTPLAELRGRYLKSLARVEARGIPADADLAGKLVGGWAAVKAQVRADIFKTYPGVLSETGAFTCKGWADWCDRSDIHWPKLPSGSLALDEDSFKKMADRHPEVRRMHYGRKMLGQLRAPELPVGPDGRLRCMLSPFGSDTGRNQPSNSKFAFGWPSWMRSLIQAPAGKVLAYVDYSSQEFAIAAALAGDRAMAEDYASGDPYLAFARRAGAVPTGATKATHPTERSTFKVAALAVQYGMGGISLADSAGMSLPAADRLIRAHQDAYPDFWRWRQSISDHVGLGGELATRFGWRRKLRPNDRATSIGNFLVQGAGAETLRLAIIALEESGHRVVAPVHDALLVELDEDELDAQLAEVGRLMGRAAVAVTGGLEVRTDAELVRPGEHYKDGRGREMWELVAPVIGAELGADGFPRDCHSVT